MTMTKTTHLPPRLSGPPKRPGGPAASGSGMPGLTPKEFVRIVRKRKWMILLIWSICTGLAVIITALWYAYFPSYTARAVLAAQPPEDVMAQIGASRFPQEIIERYKLDQAHLVEAAVLAKAVEDRRIQQTEWYRKNQDKDVIKELGDAVRVRPIVDTSYIEVSMIGREKKDLPNIVNVIVETAEKFAGQIETADIQQRIIKLKAVRDRRAMQLKAINETIGTTRSTSELAGVRERRSASVIELDLLLREVGEAQSLQAEAEAGLQSVIGSQQDGTLINDPQIQGALQINPEYRGLTMRLAELKTSLSSLTRRLGPDHRQVKATQGAVESVALAAEELRKQIVADTIRMVVQSYKLNAVRAGKQLAGLVDRRNQVQQRLRDLEHQLSQIAGLTEEADMVRKELTQINQTLMGLEVQIRQGPDKRQAGAMLVRYRASEPREITRPKWSLNISVGVGVGLALAFGLAFLLELTDTSIRNPGDIARRIDLPLLGMVPHGDDLDEVVEDFRRVTLLEPHSPAAEAFRQIRTNLLFSGPAEQRQCLLVTSPAPEDGRTTVVMNLAASVAQAGHRVLVVDANFRQPAIADMFPDAKKAGLSSALVGQANWRDVVSATGVPNCDVITAGPLPPNPAELLGSGVLGEIITEMKAEYDQILFDGSPAMVVSDASVLATQVDAVILVVRAHANSIGIVQRTAAQLRHVGAHLLGAVLQGVRTTAGGYLRKTYQTFYEYHQRPLP